MFSVISVVCLSKTLSYKTPMQIFITEGTKMWYINFHPFTLSHKGYFTYFESVDLLHLGVGNVLLTHSCCFIKLYKRNSKF